MICPKCSFEQPDGSTDCARCGVVFSRYRANGAAGASGTILPVEPISPIAPIAPGSPASSPAAETLYGGPIPPSPPPPHMYGDALPPPSSRPGLHTGRTFEVGSLLGETFQTYFSNFVPFVLLTTLAFVPLLGYLILVPLQQSTVPEMLRTGGVAFLLQLLCATLATAAITFGVFQQMRGRPTSVSDSLQVGLSNLLPVVGVALLQILAILLGFVACFLPAIFISTMLAVAVPVAVEERPGAFAALRRSSELTDGYRWIIFCVLFVLGLITIGASLLVGVVTAAFASIPILALLIRQAASIVASGLTATAAAVLYYRLRSVKESIDIENLASVFD